MNLLLDTHALLWFLGADPRLPGSVASKLVKPDNGVFASAASAWEIAIKQSLDKIRLPGPAETWLQPAVERSGIDWLAIEPADALRVRSLPWHHRDPFDRLLVAQAMGGYTLVTHDEQIRSYGVPVLWG